MTMATEGTGIFMLTVTTAEGRVLQEAGNEDYLDDFLAELGSVETVVDIDMHEMSWAEVDEYGLVWDSPGTSPEEEGA
jgi:hypothetical protein